MIDIMFQHMLFLFYLKSYTRKVANSLKTQVKQHSCLKGSLHHFLKINFNFLIQHAVMSQSIPTGYIPPGNPRGFAQKTCPGGRDLTFESCPGAGNSTRTGIMWKMEVKLQKNYVDQIFTGENKETS